MNAERALESNVENRKSKDENTKPRNVLIVVSCLFVASCF
jgi:hypothetical protein